MATWETLCENKDFRTLYYRGDSRVHAGLVTYVRRNRLGHPRIGITTGKKVGCAVKRSRARRVIREGFRPLLPLVGGYDIVFVATPGENYSLAVEPGADRPRYDEAILGYIDRVQDPVRFEINFPLYDGDDVLNGENGPTAIWLTTPFDVIPFISVIVFVVLGLICIWLIKSTNPPKQEL